MPNTLVFAFVLGLSAPGFASLGSYTARELQALANGEGHYRIENLLARISDTEDLITLKAKSQDPEQFADETHPRIIATRHPFFGVPKSVIGIVGKKGEKGWDRILMLERSSGPVAFVPHVLEFPAERTGKPAPVIWHRSPPACLRCHSAVVGLGPAVGHGAMPIWDAYPLVPFFYGEEEGGDENAPSWIRLERVIARLAEIERYRVLRIPTHSYPALSNRPQPPQAGEISRQQLHRDLGGDVTALGAFFDLRKTVRMFTVLRSSPMYRQAVPVLLACGFDSSNSFFRSVAKHAFGEAPTETDLQTATISAGNKLATYLDAQIERKLEFENSACAMDEAQAQLFRAALKHQITNIALREKKDPEFNARFRWTLARMGMGFVKFDLTLENSGAVQGPVASFYQKLSQLILQEEFRREPALVAKCEPRYRTHWSSDQVGASFRTAAETVWTFDRDRIENLIRHRATVFRFCPSEIEFQGSRISE